MAGDIADIDIIQPALAVSTFASAYRVRARWSVYIGVETGEM